MMAAASTRPSWGFPLPTPFPIPQPYAQAPPVRAPSRRRTRASANPGALDLRGRPAPRLRHPGRRAPPAHSQPAPHPCRRCPCHGRPGRVPHGHLSEPHHARHGRLACGPRHRQQPALRPRAQALRRLVLVHPTDSNAHALVRRKGCRPFHRQRLLASHRR